ncbi:hypothetical protein [Massilia sp. GCM10023247]|uniref:hypothetical protein n=1 Tax=Massilia sp. GCM10023247 TaxID=3252643 RepID=UPI003609EA3F
MLPSFLRQIVAKLLRARAGEAPFWDGVRLPGGLFAQTRCARHIEATARRIGAMGMKIATLSKRLSAGSIPGMVDADRSLRRMLCELKDDLAGMRRDLALWRTRECRGRAGARLEQAIAQLNRIAAETHAAADRLVRQIEEYDSARSA